MAATVERASKGTVSNAHDAQPQRPPLRSNFDLEPNPFEQSFSSTRTPHSNSDASSSSVPTQASLAAKQNGASSSPPTSKLQGETPKPMLPPLASIASPSDNSYAWGMSSADMGSLRSGPLSPTMLAGPQPQSGNAGPSAMSIAFDASSFGRTGLTPSTGLTPLVGGPVSFPPPSPNTAAFLAMVSNSTTAATLASTTAATITPNTLSAITGVLNGASMPQAYPFPARGESYSAATGSTPDGQQVNGLFLLSQAHQELAKREEAQRASSATLSTDTTIAVQPNGTAAGNAPRRAPKRKTTEPPAPAATPATRNAAKKPRAAPAKSKRGKRGESSTGDDMDDMDDMMDDDMDEEMMMGSTPGNKSKKPETEEEKRRNFLERNRQAALKCRQRKKAWLAQLQAKVEFLATENERLNAALLKSSEEINRLTALVNAQSVVTTASGNVTGSPVSFSVNKTSNGASGGAAPDVVPAGPNARLPIATVVGGGRGFGY
ncbi:hypothetical protein EXIGLDRAFT_599152 [Exidia glandulosa HHB12029]|uniref:BZIP domain-containing protein n=1 Tax=Exidia glandulosa HHB12029 TaxID=1314781 RepID=A0A165QPK2_EXIGL|nr:hypothetical protein EXIGLDRAFT_599152 [Exidia glandulosa HHB12029]